MKANEVKRGRTVALWRPVRDEDGTVYPVGTPGIVQSDEHTVFPLVALKDGDDGYMKVVQCAVDDLTTIG